MAFDSKKDTGLREKLRDILTSTDEIIRYPSNPVLTTEEAEKIREIVVDLLVKN